MSPAPSATGTTPRPLRQDAVRNRRQLIDAARSVFGHEGLESGVETVAKRAGVGTGTLYRHFPSKDDLIAALVDDLSDEVEASADAGIAKADGSGLHDFLSAAGEIQARNQGLLCRLWVGSAPTARTDVIRAKIGQLVDDAHAAGTLVASVGQPDILLILHGLRGVIEANYASRPDAWKRYLELTSAALLPAPADA